MTSDVLSPTTPGRDCLDTDVPLIRPQLPLLGNTTSVTQARPHDTHPPSTPNSPLFPLLAIPNSVSMQRKSMMATEEHVDWVLSDVVDGWLWTLGCCDAVGCCVYIV